MLNWTNFTPRSGLSRNWVLKWQLTTTELTTTELSTEVSAVFQVAASQIAYSPVAASQIAVAAFRIASSQFAFSQVTATSKAFRWEEFFRRRGGVTVDQCWFPAGYQDEVL